MAIVDAWSLFTNRVPNRRKTVFMIVVGDMVYTFIFSFSVSFTFAALTKVALMLLNWGNNTCLVYDNGQSKLRQSHFYSIGVLSNSMRRLQCASCEFS